MGFFEDFDRSTARAWDEFRVRLADHVAAMGDDDILIVEVEAADEEEDEDGAAPYVQFCGWGEDLVRCEVSSNNFLLTKHRLGAKARAALHRLGWNHPTSADEEDADSGSSNYHLDVSRSYADRLAWMTVTALREVFAVPHPCFLVAEGLLDPTPAPDATNPEDPDADEPLAVTPVDSEHLRRLVDQTLTPVFGHEPTHDEDGDIPVVNGSNLLYVRVVETAPVVELFSVLVSNVTKKAEAAFEVAVLNREVPYMKFALVGDRVLATMQIPAMPFAPEHLRVSLALMSQTADRIEHDLAARIGGRLAFADDSDQGDDDEPTEDDEPDGYDDDDVDDDPTHPAMMTLLQLDAEAPGSVTPELAASICDLDRDLILELITWNEQQQTAWRRARDRALAAGDPDDEAAVCDGEMLHAAAMVGLLRGALRVVVERAMAQHLGLPYDGRPRRRTTQRKPPPKRKPEPADPSLDEVDPDAWR